MGDNGILARTKEARDKTKEAQGIEEVRLSVMSAYISGEGTLTKANLSKELKISENSLEGESSGPWIYAGKDSCYYITSTGEVTQSDGLRYSDLKVGTKVNGYTGYTRDGKTDVTDWKVYYVDTKNNYVYIIPTEAKESGTIPTTPTLTTEDEENIFMEYTGTNQLLAGVNANRFKVVAAGLLGTMTSSEHLNEININQKNILMTEYILDSYNWRTYMNDNAEWAIGGPTAELLSKSLNQENLQKGYGTFCNRLWDDSKSSAEGYLLNLTGTVLNSESVSYTQNNKGYWLACPYSKNSECIWTIGNILMWNGWPYYTQYTFRPIVCLKSGIQIYPDGKGEYTLNKSNN